MRFAGFCRIVVLFHIMSNVWRKDGAMRKMTLGFIGGGHLAGALIKGLGKVISLNDIWVSDPSEERRAVLANWGCRATPSNSQIVEKADFIVLAVRPDAMERVLTEIACLSDGKCFLSVAAGLSVRYIRGRLAPGARVMRAMPNMNAEYGAAASVIARDEDMPARFREFAVSLFSASGLVLELPESLFSAVTSLSGSGPAYFFAMASAMIRGAVEQGIPQDAARLLAAQTMLGSAETLLQSGREAGALADAVAVPGGTTEAALCVLRARGWQETLEEAMRACAARSDVIAENWESHT